MTFTAPSSMALASRTFFWSPADRPRSPISASGSFPRKGFGILDHHGALLALDQVLQGRSLPTTSKHCKCSNTSLHKEGHARLLQGAVAKSINAETPPLSVLNFIIHGFVAEPFFEKGNLTFAMCIRFRFALADMSGHSVDLIALAQKRLGRMTQKSAASPPASAHSSPPLRCRRTPKKTRSRTLSLL